MTTDEPLDDPTLCAYCNEPIEGRGVRMNLEHYCGRVCAINHAGDIRADLASREWIDP